MKLVERMFVVDLIKRNYRRKLLISLIGLTAGICILAYPLILKNELSQNAINLFFVLGVSSLAISISGWIVSKQLKDKQLGVIEDHKGTDFDFLLGSRSLKEYFS